MTRGTLVLMLKEPAPGRVKTRLARDIGATAAASWYRHQACRTIRRLRDPRWRLVLAVSPDRAGMASRVWPSDLSRVAQGQGDLGARMARAMRAAAPTGPVLVAGSDIPGLRRPHVARAFSALGAHAAVIGPATDGGYWCVGLRRAPLRSVPIFASVRWSTRHAMADTLATLPGPVALVDTLADVDTGADLARAKRP